MGHEVWEGNKADVKAFHEMIQKVKSRFALDKVIFVCDRGMVSEKNLKMLEKEQYQYIVGVRMRQLSREEQEELLGEDGFERVAKNLKVKEINWKDRRYIVCFNPEEAEEEKRKRKYFRRILEDKVKHRLAKEWIMKNGYKKYIDIVAGEILFNEERLSREEIFDGKWVLLTNTRLPAKEVSLYYKGLSQIESGFRTLKSELEMGPIYHYVERRIRAHVFICFLALVLRITLEKKLKALDGSLGYSEVMRDLRKMKAVQFRVRGELLVTRTDFFGLAHKAFAAVKLKPPPQILSEYREM